MATKKPETWTGTKKDFITTMSKAMPNEIVEAGKAHGLKLTLAHVYAVRSLVRRQAKRVKAAPSKSPGPATRSPRGRRARMARRSPTASANQSPARPSSTARRAGPGAQAPRAADPSLSVLREEVLDPKYEEMLKAVAFVLGFPRAMRLLESERRRIEGVLLGRPAP